MAAVVRDYEALAYAMLGKMNPRAWYEQREIKTVAQCLREFAAELEQQPRKKKKASAAAKQTKP